MAIFRLTMPYEVECWEAKVFGAEMHMVRCMCGVIRKNRIMNECITRKKR